MANAGGGAGAGSANVAIAGAEELSVCLHESDPRRRRTMPRRSKLCSTIMIAATIVALAWLFVSAIAGAPGNWGYLFWLPWLIGGLSCGIVNVVVDERG